MYEKVLKNALKWYIVSKYKGLKFSSSTVLVKNPH
jgi:hypothetical protein